MKLSLLLVPLFFLSSCSIDWNDEKKFAKKQECISYKEKILENGKGGYINSLSLKEIFYSPQRNSCLYIVKDDTVFSIYDYLSNTIVEQSNSPMIDCGGLSKLGTAEFTKCSEEINIIFDKKIQELKGE